MCEDINAFEDFCNHFDDLIFEGHFDKLCADLELPEYQDRAAQCIACQHQYTFYHAVGLRMYQDNPYSAEALLRTLIDADQVDPRLRARALNLLGMHADLEGRYSDALHIYQRSVDLCKELGEPRGQARALLNQAIIRNNFLHDPAHALVLLEEAERLLTPSAYQDDLVRIWNERGVCWLNMRSSNEDRWYRAQQAFEATHTRCRAMKNRYLLAICEINLGRLAQQRGKWSKAEGWYGSALRIFRKNIDDTDHGVLAELTSEVQFYLGESARAQKQFVKAKRRFNSLLKLAESSNSPHFRALAYLGRARVEEQQNHDVPALKLYWQAVTQIELIRAAQGIGDVRLDFQAQWKELYRHAAACAIRCDQIEDAVLFTEYARARLLLDTLGRPPETFHPNIPQTQLDELHELQVSLYKAYEQQIAGALDRAGLAALHELEIQLAALHKDLTLFVEDTAPPQLPPTLSHIQAKLSNDAIILSYFDTATHLVAFAIDRRRVRISLLPASVAQCKTRLNQAGQLRDILPDEYTERLSPMSPNLQKLYGALLAPVADWVADHTTVYVVPETELRQIPLHLLTSDPDQPSPLAAGNRRCIYLPSAGVLTRLPELKLDDTFVAVGYNGPKLQITEAHAEQVARAASGWAISGALAQRATVMNAWQACSQLYFAGHNVFSGATPMDCGLLLADHMLTLPDIQQLRLAGSRVVLSACFSGLVAERGGDWLGLCSAFLQAGAAQVMGTLWQISEVVTCLLMDRFWGELTAEVNSPPDIWVALKRAQEYIRSIEETDIAAALQMYPHNLQSYLTNQLQAIQRTRPTEKHPLDHPYYWGPFVLVSV